LTERILNGLARRIRMLVARGVVSLVNDALKVRQVQVMVLGDAVNAQQFQEYGFTSVPLQGAEGVVASMSGVASHLILLATEDGRYRPNNLQPGQVALYTDEGDQIIFQRGRVIAITAGSALNVTAPQVTVAASTKVTLNTPEVDVTGKLNVTGDITTNGQVTAAIQVTADGITLTSRAAA
jgi:phage baseplate assembly protein V